MLLLGLVNSFISKYKSMILMEMNHYRQNLFLTLDFVGFKQLYNVHLKSANIYTIYKVEEVVCWYTPIPGTTYWLIM